MTRVPPIAVVALSALLPGAPDTGGFWRAVVAGADQVTEVPATHWLAGDHYDPDPAAPDRAYTTRGAFLPPVVFDPLAYGIPPKDLSATDTSQLLALIVADRLLGSLAAGRPVAADRERTAVVLGTSALKLLTEMAGRIQRPVWLKALREHGMPEDEALAVCDTIAAQYAPWREATLPGLLSNVVAGRIANRFDLHGGNYTADAACASSLAALSAAVGQLALGQADLVVTGGVDTLNDPVMYTSFSKTPALSPTGDCRPFSDRADGMVLGEGVVMFALKRLADAERDGDHVHAVVRGIGMSSDGHGTAIYAPLPEGQVRALRRAYEAAGYGPGTVELIEAHGTGTAAGDAAEIAALRAVFGEAKAEAGSDSSSESDSGSGAGSGRRGRQWCALGSVKSQIGHTKNAAGAAGLLKAVLAVEHKVLPPTIKVTRPNPALGLDDSPFHLNTEARPWISARPHPRRAGVSSFGFGGTNFHVTVEEYVPGAYTGGDASGEHGSRPTGEHAAQRPGRLIRTSATELVPLAADSADALLEKCASLRADPDSLAGIARAAQRGFRPTAPVRLAVVARTRDDLNEKLATAAERIGADPAAAFTDPRGVHYDASAPLTGRVAFLFPGQGGQYPDMGAAVAIAYPQARQEWDRAARALAGPPGDGRPGPDGPTGDPDSPDDLPRVVFPPPAFDDAVRERQAAELERTEWAQPALAAHSLALAAVLRAAGLRPDAVAGHSFGELVALHLAGCYDASALVRLARRRGELMRDAATAPGAMTAVSAPLEQVSALLTALDHGDGDGCGGDDGDGGDGGTRAPELWVANHNAPDQVVVAGTRPAIERLEARLTAASVRWTRLRTATAFHSPVVAAAVPELRAFLDGLDVRPPALDVYANASADRYPADAGPDAVRDRVAGHLTSPVRFAEQIRAMHDDGVRVFVEVGAGDTLTGLTGRILTGREHLAVSLDRRGAEGTAALHDGLARLAAHGIALKFDELWAPFAPAEETSMQTSPSAASVELTGANHGKPYPPPGGAAALPPPNPPRPEPGAPAQVPVPGNGMSPTAAPAPYGTAPGQAGRATATGPGTPFPGAAADPAAGYAPAAGHAPVPASYAPAVPVPQDQWSTALREAHQQVSAAHATYQRVTAEAHMAFLRMSETALTGHQPVAVPPAGPAPAPYALPAPPYAVAEPFAHSAAPPLPDAFTPAPQAYAPAPAPEAYAPAPTAYAPAPVPEATWSYTPVASGTPAAPVAGGGAETPAASPAPAEPSDSGEGSGGLPDEAAVLSIVADRTGYPEEVLDADMDLAADLGVDSIKRVEILSALRHRYPGLPDLDSRTAHQARTVRQVVAAFAPAPAGAPAAADGPAQAGRGGRGGTAESSPEGPAPPSAALAPGAQQRTATEPAPADVAHAAPAPAAASLVRLAVRAVPAPAPGLALPGLIGSRVAVTDDGTGVAQALLPLLHEAGVRAFLAHDITDITGASGPAGTSGDIDGAVGTNEAAVTNTTGGTDGVIVLDGLGILDAPTAVRRAFRAARALAPRAAARKGVFVTVQDTGGDFGLSGAVPWRAVTGALAGLARTVGAEWPQVSAKAVDCARGDRPAADVARDIARELLTGGATPDAGLAADGTRRVLTHAEAPLTGPASGGVASTGPVSTGPVSTGPVCTAALPADASPDRNDACDDARDDTAAHRGGAAPGRDGGARSGASPLDGDSVVVVTGGARGVTAAVVRALAETYGCRILLLGRTEPADATAEPEEVRQATDEAELRRAVTARLRASGEATPRRIRAEAAAILAAREIRATVAGAEAAGARVRYVALDVRDRTALETALTGVRREWGPVTALIHGAGVLADSRIEDKDDEAFDRVFDTKVEGLRNLLAATADDPLRVLCVFSSVAAVYGNPGQSDYAMANEAVTQMALAEAARRPGCLVRAIAWGPWDGGMVDGTLAGRFRAAGVPLIPAREGARACLAELRAPGGDVPVVLAAGGPAPAPGVRGGGAGQVGGTEGVGGVGGLPGPGGEVLVTRAAHPYLADHEIGGVPVLPAAMALEWFTALAGPDRTVTDLRVLSKVALTGFHTDGRDSGDAGGDLLCLTETAPGPANAPARTDAPGSPPPGVILELRYGGYDKAVPNYRARAVPAGRTPPSDPADRVAPPVPSPPPYEGTVYDGLTLFHGPAFQCLREVGGLSAAAGATGTVAGLRAAGWPGGPWHTDPLAVDGALQLATLWAREVLGGAALPMGVGAFVWHRPGPLGGPASLRVNPGPVGPAEAECDVELTAPDGTPLAVLTGVRLVARPR